MSIDPVILFFLLGLVAGVAVCATLQQAGLRNPRLKWPNDIVCGNAKLGGILIEMRGEADISERHRHRYEFNNRYLEALESAYVVADPALRRQRLALSLAERGTSAILLEARTLGARYARRSCS